MSHQKDLKKMKTRFLICLRFFEDDNYYRGVSKYWTKVNHVAIVVSDVGRSLSFYTDVVGMKQVIRPNFDRFYSN